MPTDANTQKPVSSLESVSQRRFDARFPLAIITGSFFIMGATALCRVVFLLVASAYVEFRLSVWSLGYSAVMGLVAGFFTAWYNVPKSSSS